MFVPDDKAWHVPLQYRCPVSVEESPHTLQVEWCTLWWPPWSCWNLDLNFSIYFGVTDLLCRQLTHCAGANGDWGSPHMLREGGHVPHRNRRGAYRYPSNHFRGSSVPHQELLQRACCQARAEQGAVPAHHLDGTEWDTDVEEFESMGGGGGEWVRPCSRLPLGHYACRQFKFLWTGTGDYNCNR